MYFPICCEDVRRGQSERGGDLFARAMAGQPRRLRRHATGRRQRVRPGARPGRGRPRVAGRSRAGINHIDTAQYYGPGVVNELIREALYPYPTDLAIVSKVAARRDDHGAVLAYDEPDQLRAGIEDNLATLGTDRLAAVNLRLMDGAVPGPRFDAQLAAMIR